MAKKNVGRPKKRKASRRDNVLRIRLTAEERRTIEAAAAAKFLDTSAWARSILVCVAQKDHE